MASSLHASDISLVYAVALVPYTLLDVVGITHEGAPAAATLISFYNSVRLGFLPNSYMQHPTEQSGFLCNSSRIPAHLFLVSLLNFFRFFFSIFHCLFLPFFCAYAVFSFFIYLRILCPCCFEVNSGFA